MNRFFQVIPVEDALAVVRRIAPAMGSEDTRVDLSAGRVLATPVVADLDIPGFDRSVVDGFAVRYAETAGAGDSSPVILRCVSRIPMGPQTAATRIGPGECAYIPTGGVMPEGADAVVMIEYTEEVADTILIKKAASHGENVLVRDEDFKKGETVFSAGRRISPQDAGVLAACGYAQVKVAKKPVVGIISTGNELVPADTIPAPGQVRDANAPMLAAYLAEYGCIPRMYGIVRDEKEVFLSMMEQAVRECDVVLLSGGSSKDERDMTAGTLAALGEVLVHGIAIAPGKPTIIGRVNTIPVFGLPGHPASTLVVMIAIVRPLLDRMLGIEETCLRTVSATLASNLPSQRGREEYVRVRVTDGIATPLFGKSGLLHTLSQSDGLVRVPAGAEGMEKGSRVDVILW